MRRSKEILLHILLSHFKKFIAYPEGTGDLLKGLRGRLIRFASCKGNCDSERDGKTRKQETLVPHSGTDGIRVTATPP